VSRSSHLEAKAAYDKEHYATHREEMLARTKVYNRAYNKEHLEHNKASNAKRHRSLGYNMLNSPQAGCVGHHINLNDVIHMPVKDHTSIKHNVFTGYHMKEINALAGAYYTEDWT
jgi:hypothetical protein